MSENAMPGLVIDIEGRITKLEQSLKRANDKQKRAADEMERRARESAAKIDAAYSKMGGGMSTAMSRMGTAFDRNRSAIQNTSYQLQDVIVQITSGTDAAKALGMQLPQMLGGLGAVGAVAGVAAGALLPLAASLLKSGADAGTLKDRLEELKTSTDTMTSTVEAAAVPVEELRLKYRDLADEIARANGIAVGFAAARAKRDALGAAKSLSGEMGVNVSPETVRTWTGSGYAEIDGATEQARADAMEELRRKTGATADQVERLAQALRRTDSSNSLDAVVRDSENLLSVIDQLYQGADDIQRQFLEGFAATVTAVMDQAKRQIDAQTREDQRLAREYDANTSKLKQLAADRQAAEAKLTAAKQKGDTEQVRSMQRVIASIDDQIFKLRELGRTSKSIYEQLATDARTAAGNMLSGAFEFMTGQTPGQFVTDAKTADKGLLELIASKESGGDYNATLDHGRWTGGPRDLVNMSLNEILALGDRMRTPENRALYGNGKGSSALGRYQITGQTLRGLMETLGLTGEEAYDPAMQDRLAMELIRQRRPQGVEGLRQEWAGLKNVPAHLIDAALGNTTVPTVDPEVARRAAQAKDEEARARDRNAAAAEREAEAQAKSTVAADTAVDAARRALEAQTEGTQTLIGLFGAATEGADSLASALKNIALQIVEAQVLQPMLQGSGIAGWLGRLMGAGGGDPLAEALARIGLFSAGGFTGQGGKYEPAGLVHKGEYVISKAAVERLGVGNLEALHQSALRGYASGGLVGDTGKAKRAVSSAARAAAGAPTITITGGPITVNGGGGSPEANADLARQIAQEHERSMRALVQQELVRQMRPGNILARR